MENYIGSMLDNRYLVESLIGIGGMSNIYKGLDTREQRVVAIKLLRDEFATSSEFVRRFRDESKAVAALNHENIVKVYDIILSIKNPCIVMEYVNGITLKEHIGITGALGLTKSVNIAIAVLKALSHAHANGVIHRDIKPHNIMLTDGSDIKVMDFGIAKLTAAQARTITDTTIGSVHYTSPEQVKSCAEVDLRTDIYSMGIVLYEMLTGKLPFEADTSIKVAMMQVDKEPVKPSAINPSIPLGLEQIILRAMAKNSAERYSSADEMIADLETILRDSAAVFTRSGLGVSGISIKSKSFARNSVRKSDKKPEKTKKEFKKPSFMTVLFGITMGFVVGSLIYVSVLVSNNNPFVTVPETDMPDLVGQNYDSIVNDEKYKGFKLEKIDEEYSSHYDEGIIYEQYPKPGKRVKVGSTIRIKVSSGIRKVVLPDQRNKEGSLVQLELTEMGLETEIVTVESANVDEGYVISTDPPAGTDVAVGSKVVISISLGSGKGKNPVPDLVTLPLEYAKQKIVEAGFQVGIITRRVDNSYPFDTVIAQSPNYPAPHTVGATINLVVSGDSFSTTTPENQEVNILTLLPIDIEKSVSVRVTNNGVTMLSENMIPSERRIVQISVPISFEDANIRVLINDKLYMSYSIPFSTGAKTYTTLEDNSVGFTVE